MLGLGPVDPVLAIGLVAFLPAFGQIAMEARLTFGRVHRIVALVDGYFLDGHFACSSAGAMARQHSFNPSARLTQGVQPNSACAARMSATTSGISLGRCRLRLVTFSLVPATACAAATI